MVIFLAVHAFTCLTAVQLFAQTCPTPPCDADGTQIAAKRAASAPNPGSYEQPFQSREFSVVKPVEFDILKSTTICHWVVPADYFQVSWEAGSQKVVAVSSGIAPVLTFKLAQNTSLIVREDQFGGIWEAAGHESEASHPFRPLHKGYLLGYKGYNCWAGGGNKLIGMTVVTEENEKQAKALHELTWRGPGAGGDPQSPHGLGKPKSAIQKILESLGNSQNKPFK